MLNAVQTRLLPRHSNSNKYQYTYDASGYKTNDMCVSVWHIQQPSYNSINSLARVYYYYFTLAG